MQGRIQIIAYLFTLHKRVGNLHDFVINCLDRRLRTHHPHPVYGCGITALFSLFLHSAPLENRHADGFDLKLTKNLLFRLLNCQTLHSP